MDNQHKQISGYRDLSQEEIDLMNTLKQQEAVLVKTINNTSLTYQSVLNQVITGPERGAIIASKLHDHHAIMRMAHEHFMVGFMLAVRSIAQPQPVEIKS